MVLEYLVQLIVDTLRIPFPSVIAIFALGYLSVFIFLNKIKFWEKLSGADRTIWTIFIGFGTYYLIFTIWSIILVTNNIFFNDVVDVYTINIFTLFSMGMIILGFLMNIYTSFRKLVDGLLQYLRIITFILISFWLALVVEALFVLLTPFSFLSGKVLLNTIAFVLPLVILIIAYTMVKHRRFEFDENAFLSFIKSIKFTNKRKVFVILAIVGLFSYLFFFFGATVSYGDKETIEYDFNGADPNNNPQRIDLVNSEPSYYPWKSLRYVKIPLIIYYSGAVGWLPIDYGEILPNETSNNGKVMSVNIANQTIRLPNEFPDIIRRLEGLGIRNISLDKNYNKIVLNFNKFTYLDTSKIGKAEIFGFEYESSRNFILQELEPKIERHHAILYLNVTNSYDKPIIFRNIVLLKSTDFHPVCNYIYTTHGNMSSIQNNTKLNITCEKYGFCLDQNNRLTEIKLDSETWINNNIRIEQVAITPKTNVLFGFRFDCVPSYKKITND